MVLSISDFQKNVKGGGARANLFVATINNPIDETTVEPSQFLIKTAELPGSTITPIIIPFRGRQLKISGDRTFDPWTVTVINDNDFTIRKVMEDWMAKMNNHEDNEGANTGYFADMSVAQLDRGGNELAKYNLVGAWPSDLGPISVSFDNENQIEEYQVTFQYQYWTREGTKVGGLPTSSAEDFDLGGGNFG